MKETIKWAMEGLPSTPRFEKYDFKQTGQWMKIIGNAAEDPFLGGFVKTRPLKDFVGFFYDHNELAGFAIPRKDSDGYYRTGAIYVEPKFRSKGIAKAFVQDYFKDKKGRAFIEPDNTASIALFTSAGFVKTDKKVKHDGDELYEYLKE